MRRLRRLSITGLLAIACAEPTRPSALPDEAGAVERTEPPAQRVEYRMAPVMDGDAITALSIEMRFRADASGTTRVSLPTEWASARELWKFVRDVEVDGAIEVADDGAALRTIQAEPNAELTLRYRVVSAYDHEPTAADGQPFAPIVRPRWFYAFGEALFAAPEADDRTAATFTWADAPSGFEFVSDLQQLPDGVGTLRDIRDSIVLGGPDTKIYRERVGDAEIRVGIHGRFAFEHAAFVAMARAIIAAERDFWGEHGEPFTVAMAPLLGMPGSRSLGGTGRSDGFTILMSDDAPIEPVRHLIAHEYFHTWNADRLGGQQDGSAEMLGKWFAEGFTEFYTWRLLLRSGIYGLEEFVADWNAALFEYASSPARNEPNSKIAEAYWTDDAVGRLPYRRGPLLAAIWDRRLRDATNGDVGLDDVMHAMREKIKAAGDRRLAPDAATLFLPTYVELGGPDLANDVDRWVERGETIALPEDVFGGCVRVRSEKRPVFELGFDAAATQAAGNVITGVQPGSSAHKAGLRDGMKIVRKLEGTRGDARKRYAFRVHDGKRERTIRYAPRGRGELEVQQLHIVDAQTPEARAACARTLAAAR